MFPSMQQAMIKRHVTLFLTDTCTITQRTTTDLDGYGGVGTSEDLVYSGACRLIFAGTMGDDEQDIIGDRAQISERYRLIVPATVTLQEDQKVTISNVDYKVTNVRDNQSHSVDSQALIIKMGA